MALYQILQQAELSQNFETASWVISILGWEEVNRWRQSLKLRGDL